MKYRESDLTYLNKYIKAHNLDALYYQNALKELKKGRPIQYIIGEVNFYGYDFKVNESVLIPRFETELLVDKTIKKVKKYFKDKTKVLDLGTGSGCIAITLKKELDSSVTALDISDAALEVAKHNAKLNDTSLSFIKADMTTYHDDKYDVIISNPPYIAYDEEIMDIVKNNEPHLALYAKDNGLYYYEAIIKNIPNITKGKYLVALEIGAYQANDIKDIISKYLKDVTISVEKDYANFDRYIFITNIKE